MKLYEFEGYIQSIRLAEYSDKLLLLDGCCRPDVEIVLSFIKNQLNRPITDLKLVVCTHSHPDHAGAAEFLRKRTGCKIAMANVAGYWYKNFTGYLMFLTDMLLAKWVANKLGKKPKLLWYKRKLKADIYLDDQHALPGFPDWTVIYTQGHTDRDISLWHKETRVMYVADLIVRSRGRYIPPFPLFYPDRYKTSIETIENLQPENILLAHGGEVYFTNEQYKYLRSKISKQPVTHWRSVKTKLYRVLFK